MRSEEYESVRRPEISRIYSVLWAFSIPPVKHLQSSCKSAAKVLFLSTVLRCKIEHVVLTWNWTTHMMPTSNMWTTVHVKVLSGLNLKHQSQISKWLQRCTICLLTVHTLQKRSMIWKWLSMLLPVVFGQNSDCNRDVCEAKTMVLLNWATVEFPQIFFPCPVLWTLWKTLVKYKFLLKTHFCPPRWCFWLEY